MFETFYCNRGLKTQPNAQIQKILSSLYLFGEEDFITWQGNFFDKTQGEILEPYLMCRHRLQEPAPPAPVPTPPTTTKTTTATTNPPLLSVPHYVTNINVLLYKVFIRQKIVSLSEIY
jgi:hypothetical protein